jgi:Glycosyltransferase family 25 (LPS biosynthesis protein)
MTISSFAKKFDRVFCINLPNSIDRRQYITEYFKELRIDNYEFFKSTDKADSIVSKYYANEKVAKFPPCFRCGKLSCGNDECNNVLIAPQVATFITYLRLWQHIIDENIGTALIIEDDIKFTDYAEDMACLVEDGFAQLGFQAHNPALLRLGWALCDDHKPSNDPGFERNLIKMSNPLHAITNEFARKLISGFQIIDTTVDVYQHKQFEDKACTYTVMPPLAYELSWSTGEMNSLIHPKPIRVQYLKENQPGEDEKITAAEKAVTEHIAHILHRPFLVVGHPRCGSGYMSKLTTALGLPVGHEKMEQYGISSWMFAVLDENPFAFDKYAAFRNLNHFEYCIHHVRNPKFAIPSIMRENKYSEISYEFRRKHIKLHFEIDMDEANSEIDKAVLSYIYWNKIILKSHVDLTVRIEDADKYFTNWLLQKQIVGEPRTAVNMPPKDINSGKPYKGIVYDKPCLTDMDWHSISPSLLLELNQQCRQFGYEDC